MPDSSKRDTIKRQIEDPAEVPLPGEDAEMSDEVEAMGSGQISETFISGAHGTTEDKKGAHGETARLRSIASIRQNPDPLIDFLRSATDFPGLVERTKNELQEVSNKRLKDDVETLRKAASDQIEILKNRFESDREKLEDEVRVGTFRQIEVFGVFASILALVLTAISAAISQVSPSRSLLIIISSFAGLAAILLLLRKLFDTNRNQLPGSFYRNTVIALCIIEVFTITGCFKWELSLSQVSKPQSGGVDLESNTVIRSVQGR